MIHELFAEDELARGESRSVVAGGIKILVVRKEDGSYRALRDVCPHLGVQLSRGVVQTVLDGQDVGDYEVTDVVAARCSWHGYEFDLDTGRCVADPRWRVKSYPVTIRDGHVLLER
jgi:nitrite reductase/ring-hydroxylating ferredoxin subunit